MKISHAQYRTKLDILACAASHKYFKSLWKDGVSDGFVHKDKEDDLVQKVACGSYEQCNCSAHCKLLDPSLNEYDRDELEEIIRSPSKLCPATGNAFAVCLLKQLFKAMNLPKLKLKTSGTVDGVSYVLLCNGKEYKFSGMPDFVVHQERFGAGRILVGTGEIQSTRHPDVQNSIYGIGHLLNNFLHFEAQQPVVCITLFQKKMQHLQLHVYMTCHSTIIQMWWGRSALNISFRHHQ